MSGYSSGKNSNAYCDICGRPVKYRELRDHIYNQKRDGLKVCSQCDDEDNPQLQVGRFFRAEPQALWQPRPDTPELATSRAFARWNPIMNLVMEVTLGEVSARLT